MLPRALLPKKQLRSVSGQDLIIEVRKWLADFEEKEILQKFLFLHLIPKHLKDKISSSLSLGFEVFRKYVILTCDLDMIKTKDRAKHSSCLKKQKQNQQLSYQRRNKLRHKTVICGEGHPKNSFDRCFKKQQQNPQLSYQSRNKIPVQKVNYEQRHSRSFFSRDFNKQNQQFSYQKRKILLVQQVNYEQKQSRHFLTGVLSIKISNYHTKEVVNFQFIKSVIGKHSLSLNKTVRDTKTSQENTTNKDVMYCNSSNSNFTQTSHRSNKLSNQQKQNLTKATAPTSIQKEDKLTICLLLLKNYQTPQDVTH